MRPLGADPGHFYHASALLCLYQVENVWFGWLAEDGSSKTDGRGRFLLNPYLSLGDEIAAQEKEDFLTLVEFPRRIAT